MATTGYVSTGAFFDTGIGIARIHGEIDYNVTRVNNTVTFSSTYARIKYVRESGTWVSFTYGSGWTWKLYLDSLTFRVSNFANGTRSVNATDSGTAVAPSINVAAEASTLSARIGAYFTGDSETFANHTISIPTVSAASGQTISASNIETTTATLNAAVSSWGTNCTAGTGQRIEYKKSTDSSWTTLAYSTSTSHSRNITGLTPATTYNIRTYTINGAGLASYSTVTTFVTKSGVKVILPSGTVENRVVKSISPTGVVTTVIATKVV